MALRELHLFAGAGGGILGGLLLGHVPVCAVELEEYPRSVLLQRQRDGILPWFPIWDDVRTFDGHPWRGRVDVIAGGFPCQDISSAGKGAGIDGTRSGLWGEFARIIGEVRPRFVFVENSPLLTSRGLGRVLGDLASLGFDAEWGVLGAADAIWNLGDPCADHERFRIWIVAVADPSCIGLQRCCGEQARGIQPDASGGGKVLPNAMCQGLSVARPVSTGEDRNIRRGKPPAGSWWATEPALGRVAHGVANRVDRLRAIGNGQVPAVAALAWEILMDKLHE